MISLLAFLLSPPVGLCQITPVEDWVTIIAPSPNAAVGAVSIDGARGRIYVAGISDYYALLLASCRLDGSVVWSRTGLLPGFSYGFSLGLTHDLLGNLYLAGGIDQGGQSDLILAKFDPLGNLMWSLTKGGAGTEGGGGIAYAASGHLYVAGTLRQPGPDKNIWTAKFDTAGTEIWARTASGAAAAGCDTGYAISVNSAEQVFVGGCWGTCAGEDGCLSGVILKYAQDGTLLWTVTGDGVRVLAVAASPDGGVAHSTWEGGVRTRNADGTIRWSFSVVGSVGLSLDHDDQGNLYVTGWVDRSDYGQLRDVLTCRLGPAGGLDWSVEYNDPAENTGEGGYGVGITDGGLVVVGGFGGSLQRGWVRGYRQVYPVPIPAPPAVPAGSLLPYPNPFSPSSGGRLRFANVLAGSSLSVLTLAGERVVRLNPDQAGQGWDGRSKDGTYCAPGVYLLVAGDGRTTGRVVLIK